MQCRSFYAPVIGAPSPSTPARSASACPRRPVLSRMPRSRRLEHGAEFLSGRAAIERHREPLLVIDALPLTQLGRGSLEVLEALAAPELLLVDPVAAFHLAVLFRTPRADVAMPDPAALYREDEGERELRAVIGLD